MTNGDSKESERVKGDLKSPPLNRLHILLLIYKGKNNKNIYTYFGITPQALNYHLKKLKQQDLISKKEGSYPAEYIVTEKAKGLLKKFRDGISDGNFREFIHFHHCQYVCPLYDTGTLKPEKSWKAGNATHHKMDLGDTSIQWCGNALWINIKSMFGKDPEELEAIAQKKASDTIELLREKHNVKTGVLTSSKTPHWEVVDPVTVSIGQLITMSTDELDINDSYNMGAGVEFKTAQDARDYFLDMPKEVKETKEILNTYAQQIQLHLQVTKQIQESYQKDQEIRQETLKTQEKLNEAIEKLNNKIEKLGEDR